VEISDEPKQVIVSQLQTLKNTITEEVEEKVDESGRMSESSLEE